MGFELIELRDFGRNHKLAAVWEADRYIGHLEYRCVDNKITAIHALVIVPNLRKKGYGTRLINEVVANPSAQVFNIEKATIKFWQKVLPESKTFNKKSTGE
jgi:GNAT superfamily N-acetyltransferase